MHPCQSFETIGQTVITGNFLACFTVFTLLATSEAATHFQSFGEGVETSVEKLVELAEYVPSSQILRFTNPRLMTVQNQMDIGEYGYFRLQSLGL